MRILLTIVLLMAVAAPASGLDRKPRKKEKKKARTEAVAEPAPAPAPPAAKPAHTERKTEPAAPAPAPLPDNDMTLGLTAAQADSLVAVWRERQCCDSFREFFDNYILVDSTQTGAVPDSVYTRRLRDLASPIQLPYNSIVRGYINRYTDSRYGTISRILGMSQYYFPLIEDACRYLKDLYAIYNDWSLAIAAYNCGPGNVNKAIARSGGNGRTFWDIYDYLPRETRGYVPAFIGASYAYAYHRQHGIELTEAPIPLATDTVRIDRIMHLQQIASTIDVPIETLRQLNPQYKLDIIPATTKPYTLVLPQRSLTQYVANEPAILAKDSLYLKEYINPANLDKKRQERSGTVYTVKKGDTLGAIARRYRVTTAQLMRWNNIKSAHKLRIGQRLRIEGR